MTYHKEISSVLSKSPPRTALVRQLCLFLDDAGLIRRGGRIDNAPVTESAKFPLLLPPKDLFIELVIRDTHVHQLHGGVNSTLTALRNRYWIHAGRKHVKIEMSHCITCKKISGLSYDIPDSPPLPRLHQAEPFVVTGVAFTNALYIHEAGVERKVYICLFTCATTRAVHLEVVTIYQCRPLSSRIADLQLGNLFLDRCFLITSPHTYPWLKS